MTFSTNNTNWANSSKSNHWRRIDGVGIVIGQFKTNDDYWAMHDGKFLSGRFHSISHAQYAAGQNLDGVDNGSPDTDGGGVVALSLISLSVEQADLKNTWSLIAADPESYGINCQKRGAI
jgi:hypothetical protein